MSAPPELSYQRPFRRQDQLQGRRDGERRIPALSEVRRRQQELGGTGMTVTVGYQVTLLAEFNGRLNEMFPAFQRAGQALAEAMRQIEDRIKVANGTVDDLREKLAAAQAPLTADELRPQSSHEEAWAPESLRNRREVWRTRRVRKAQDELDAAIARVRDLRVELAAAVRRREKELSEFGVQACQLADFYQRRITVYLTAMARSHPDGKTLYPLLEMPVVPLPGWVTEAVGVRPSDQDGSST